jgi:hypothetical protein
MLAEVALAIKTAAPRLSQKTIEAITDALADRGWLTQPDDDECYQEHEGPFWVARSEDLGAEVSRAPFAFDAELVFNGAGSVIAVLFGESWSLEY